MAEIQTSSTGNKRRKSSTPRIDLTPMVDLGFLLITFFMYTTTLARPKVMELQMPHKPAGKATTTIPAEATIVLMPAAHHLVACYKGTDKTPESLTWQAFEGRNSLRILLQSGMSRVQSLPATFSKEAHELHVLIKPDTSASYQDIVRTLDEMAINGVPYYTMMHIGPGERAAIQKLFPGAYGK